MTATLYIGAALAVMATMPAESVDMVCTSPPYLALRRYTSDKDEVGIEPAPADYLQSILDHCDAAARVLKPTGTIWLNLGDTHAGSGGAGGDYGQGGRREGQEMYAGSAAAARAGAAPDNERHRDGSRRRDSTKNGRSPASMSERNSIRPQAPVRRSRGRADLTAVDGWPLSQSVCWMPQLVGASMAYGRNLLRPDEAHVQWVTRPPITWCKPNPSVGRLTRTLRSATELVIYAGLTQQHYFDLDAVRTRPKGPPRKSNSTRSDAAHLAQIAGGDGDKRARKAATDCNPNGVPPKNWWVIRTSRYKGAHFATYPPELLRIPILTGCPPGGVVLDPFVGSGTTFEVANALGRNGIGIDLDVRNEDLIRQRVGVFGLEVIDHRQAGAA